MLHPTTPMGYVVFPTPRLCFCELSKALRGTLCNSELLESGAKCASGLSQDENKERTRTRRREEKDQEEEQRDEE